jgi:hypothetical protein
MLVDCVVTIWHSRQISPTRRVAAAPLTLAEVDGFPLEALGAVWADTLADFPPDQHTQLLGVLDEMADGKLPSSRLGHRVQVDHVGLAKTTVRLSSDGTYTVTSTGGTISPPQLMLGLIAAIHPLPDLPRVRLVDALRGFTVGQSPVWVNVERARAVLGFELGDPVDAATVKRRFRDAMKRTHPDVIGFDNTTGVQDLVNAKHTLLVHLSVSGDPQQA